MSTQPHPTEHRYLSLAAGDPAPWFTQRSTSNPTYAFSTAGGRYIVMGFFITAGDAAGQSALKAVTVHRHLFDDARFAFFGISLDPADESTGRVSESLPGIRHFWDFDGQISRLYGALPQGQSAGETRARRFWLVLDPTMRVIRAQPMLPEGAEQADFFAWLAALPPPERFAGPELQAPVLYLPNVFEPELCRHLIGLHEQNGGDESGFMRDVGGKTVLLTDPSHKRRTDVTVEDASLIRLIQRRVKARIHPEILKVHAFDASRMERYIIGCYTAEDGGHFRAHRDNTTRGTAHRRFAVSINLNADFEGGEVSFPEYGPRGFKPPPGGAVVFSCSLLHAVSPVTRGRRYAFLPFLYDDAAARLRGENARFLEGEAANYVYSES